MSCLFKKSICFVFHFSFLLIFLCNSNSNAEYGDYSKNLKDRSNSSLPSDIIDDEFFPADSGYDLDQYLYKDNIGSITGETGLLEFYIGIDRYCGVVDKTGIDKSVYPEGGFLQNYTALENMGAKVKLRIDAYDVDDDYSDFDVVKEIDEVYVNGIKMPKILSSGNNQWKIYEVEVPIKHLIFPEKGIGSTGIKPANNLIQIKIDTGNLSNPDNIWAVEVDWAYFQFYSFPRPVVFLHGKGDNSLGWKIYNASGHKDIDSGGWYKWFEEEGFVVGAVDVWSEGDPNDSMNVSVPFTDEDYDTLYIGGLPYKMLIHKGDWIDNDGDNKVDEKGERNVVHTTSRTWHEIPDENNLCFSDMISTLSRNEITSYENMKGMKRFGKIYGIKKVHFVSHSTGCFYGRKYISTVMSNTENKTKQGFEGYPVVDKFIMIAAPNHGQDPKTFLGKLVETYLKLTEDSPCTRFYLDKKWKNFNKTNLQNRNVEYYYVGGYSGWRDSVDIPDPLRPYCDLNDWEPEYGDDWLNPLDMSDQIELAYEGLGGKIGVDWENETTYPCYTWSVCYSLIGGFHPCRVETTCTHIPNDGLATIDGAKLGYGEYLERGKFALNHHTIRANAAVRNAIKDKLLPETSLAKATEYARKVVSDNESRKFIPQNPSNIPETVMLYNYTTGTIDSSSVKQEEMMLLGRKTIIHLIWDSYIGDLSIEAIDPEGVIVESKDISDESGYITIVPSAFVGGLWKFKITTSSLNRPVDYKLIAYMYDSEIKLTPETDKFNYSLGEYIRIKANLNANQQIINNSNIFANAYFAETDTFINQIQLFDDGTHGDDIPADGIFTNNEWQATQKGTIKFEIQLIVYNAASPFFQEFTDIFIDVIGNEIDFTKRNSDTGIDTNGNGLFDFITVDIGIESTLEGNFKFAGELYDANDNFIDSHMDGKDIVVGENYLKFKFDGKNVFLHGMDGPYFLKNAVLYSDDGEIKALMENVHQTKAFSYMDFEKASIFFSGEQSDIGIDKNGNGKFDYLEWFFNLTVSVADTYTISATLKNSNYKDIEILNSEQYLEVGENPCSVLFDGVKIRQSLSDGNFIIDDVSIAGGGSTIYFGSVYTTSNNYYSDFEYLGELDLIIFSEKITFDIINDEEVEISVKIDNPGTSTSSDFTIQFYNGPKENGVLIGEQTVNSIAQGETKEIVFRWNISDLAKSNYTLYIYVNPNKSISEFDFSNNFVYLDIDLTDLINRAIPTLSLGGAVIMLLLLTVGSFFTIRKMESNVN